jgi:hypothetical protein
MITHQRKIQIVLVLILLSVIGIVQWFAEISNPLEVRRKNGIEIGGKNNDNNNNNNKVVVETTTSSSTSKLDDDVASLQEGSKTAKDIKEEEEEEEEEEEAEQKALEKAKQAMPQKLGVEWDDEEGVKVDAYDPEETRKVIQFYIGGFAKSGTSFLLHKVFYPAAGTYMGRNGEIRDFNQTDLTNFFNHYVGYYPRTDHFKSSTAKVNNPNATLVQNGFKEPNGKITFKTCCVR